MRAGQLMRGRLRGMKILSSTRGRRGSKARRRAELAAGDPFHLRMPKFLRKITLKGVVNAAKKFALPLAAAVLPGAAGRIATNIASELTTQPQPTGTVGMLQSGAGPYTVPGITVTPDNQGQVYNVFDRRSRVQDQIDSEDDDTDEDVADVGDEDEDTDDEGSE
jgi:hypothetical protein